MSEEWRLLGELIEAVTIAVHDNPHSRSQQPFIAQTLYSLQHNQQNKLKFHPGPELAI